MANIKAWLIMNPTEDTYPPLSLKALTKNIIEEHGEWIQTSLLENETIRISQESRGIILHVTQKDKTTINIEAWISPVDWHNRELSALALLAKETGHPDKKTTLKIPSTRTEGETLLAQMTQKSTELTHPEQTNVNIILSLETIISRLILAESLFLITEEKIPELIERAPGLRIQSFGGDVPFQSEGTWYGYWYYFRYRSGHATLAIAENLEDTTMKPLWKTGTQYGDSYGGSLSIPEFINLFCQLAQNLEKAPFFYHFNTPETREPTNFICCWAHDLKTATEIVTKEYHLTDEEIKNLTIKETDNRKFPKQMPKFEILPKK